MIKALADNIGFQANLELRLSILKAGLKWRYGTPDGSWRERNLTSFTERLFLLDEEIRVIFYPEGLVRSDDSLLEIECWLNRNCSARLRTACEKNLFGNENVDEQNDYVIKARRACIKRPKMRFRKSK
jgi:hypothetical protein